MFFFKSCPPFRTSEPKCFSILRLFIAIIFSSFIIIYAWISFEEFVSNIDEPNLYISELDEHFTYPGFRVCPKVLSNYNGDDTIDTLNISLYKLYRDISSSQLYIPNDYSFYDNKIHGLNDLNLYDFNTLYELHNNYSIPTNANFFIRDHDNNRCRIFIPPSINDEFSRIVEFKPFFVANELLFIITLDNSSIYSYFEINFESITINKRNLTIQSALSNRNPNKDLKDVNTTLIPNQYFITRGRYVIYELILKERISYSSYFSGYLGFKASNISTFLEIEEKELASTPNASYTALELRFQYNFIIREQQKFQITVARVISNIGGFYGALSGIFVLLFGASKLTPWGICQKYVCCWSYRRSFKRHLASRYVSRAGIPLADDPRKLPLGAELSDRVAVLEHLLKEYYIDAYYLEKLRTTRKRYLDLRNNNFELLKLLGDDIDEDLKDDIALERLEDGSTS
ncbi:uncharacterized protein OCT59_002495 [Rhizophagus irregularis]|uniref:Uncharacterized protein n=1 Tax=Rhizophagus irregularis (strain DAOM 197198w) TaxID=1432141 RepID=A0A015MEZ3_RHIIW|nr:hypothetical protein RirG_133830 [Rhizophagus irregularis DAOM 197198w]UZO10917.1 hypothetical protein OCT59_002495 [Rhizophagus irregularis]GBC17946.1 hypothetical protein GLOIN_2v1841879 [Rhizophagus irregularis DAOM 181602=DAOM 197198]CAG8562351.1 802_t:CDS:2 [Rhizophagus irregularis]